MPVSIRNKIGKRWRETVIGVPDKDDVNGIPALVIMPSLERVAHAVFVWLLLTAWLLTGWGWGHVANFWLEPARATLPLIWLVLAVYGSIQNTRTSASGGKREIRLHRRLLWIVFPLLGVWFAYLPYADSHRDGLNGSPAIRWTGLLVFAFSMLLRIESIRAQGEQFSLAVAIQQHHRLTTSGPYHWIRHPAYLAMIGMLAGVSMVFANPAASIIITLLSWAWMEYRIMDEEKLLLDEFGEAYRLYRNQTRKFLPYIY